MRLVREEHQGSDHAGFVGFYLVGLNFNPTALDATYAVSLAEIPPLWMQLKHSFAGRNPTALDAGLEVPPAEINSIAFVAACLWKSRIHLPPHKSYFI